MVKVFDAASTLNFYYYILITSDYRPVSDTLYTGNNYVVGIIVSEVEIMDTRDVLFSVVMVISSFVLTYEWLGRFKYSPANSLIILSAMVMVGALAAMILSLDMRLRNIERTLGEKERSLRVNIQSIEDSVDKRMEDMVTVVDEAMDSMNRRLYR